MKLHFVPQGTMKVNNLETLQIIADPLRMQLLTLIRMANRQGETCTVKQLAQEINLPPSRLYYHIKLLEEHGLVQVAHTEVVSGILEKHYQITAYQIVADDELVWFKTPSDQPEDHETLMGLVRMYLDQTRVNIESLIEQNSNLLPEDQAQVMLSHQMFYLSQEEAEELNNEMIQIINRYQQLTAIPGNQKRNPYELVCYFYPLSHN